MCGVLWLYGTGCLRLFSESRVLAAAADGVVQAVLLMSHGHCLEKMRVLMDAVSPSSSGTSESVCEDSGAVGMDSETEQWQHSAYS